MGFLNGPVCNYDETSWEYTWLQLFTLDIQQVEEKFDSLWLQRLHGCNTMQTLTGGYAAALPLARPENYCVTPLCCYLPWNLIKQQRCRRGKSPKLRGRKLGKFVRMRKPASWCADWNKTVRTLLQERKERTADKNGQRLGRGEGESQRGPVGAEDARHRPVARAVPWGLLQAGTRQRGADRPALPSREGRHRYNPIFNETGRC